MRIAYIPLGERCVLLDFRLDLCTVLIGRRLKTDLKTYCLQTGVQKKIKLSATKSFPTFFLVLFDLPWLDSISSIWNHQINKLFFNIFTWFSIRLWNFMIRWTNFVRWNHLSDKNSYRKLYYNQFKKCFYSISIHPSNALFFKTNAKFNCV